MRRLLAILLLCCLLFLTTGYHVLYRLRIAEAKREMKKTLLIAEKEDLVHFSFSPEELAELNWENNHEFFYRGEMFDVLEQKERSGRVIISCISDQKEKALVDAYLQTGKSSSQQSTAILKLLTADYLPAILPAMKKPVQQLTITRPFYRVFFRSWEKPTLTPPPQFADFVS
ncbi:MAG TPA: hypothetical protein VFT06_06060 [Flavisolibacter sp.]|nr:hypothetical protein [Flavisolibacter sp.]